MMKLRYLFILLCYVPLFANDGAYFASGNQLIPISETQVCITKEVLTVIRKTEHGNDYVYVTVDYTFFNPGADKTILVGFEAPSPSGDVDGYPKNGAHPYMYDFSVDMNGNELPFKTAIVTTENYYQNHQILAKTEEEVIGADFNANDPDFYYVYHFNANFKSGVNTVVHTYRFDMSGSILDTYAFDYILTAANRWGNQQIDDFTLHIDMGAAESFTVKNSFFNTKEEWQVEDGRSLNTSSEFTQFVTHTGGITFTKKNFRPQGELRLSATQGAMKDHYVAFDHKINNLPKQIDSENGCTYSVDEDSFKILRNLPFAIRGYVFKTTLIQEYYLSQAWYKPNASYVASLDVLSTEEKEWLKTVKANKWDPITR